MKLTHLRLESNDIENIPNNFFKYCSKLTSLIMDHNEFKSLNSKIFYPLSSLIDVHLQNNDKFEMYCDYSFGNYSLFPRLKSIYIHQISNKCIHPWIIQLQENRKDLNINHEINNKCPIIKIIGNLPLSLLLNSSLSIQFKGIEGNDIFIKHRAYWISSNIDKCSDFREPHNFKSNEIGHQEIEIDNTGNANFLFTKKGEFMLVYKYGDNAPYLLYNDYILNII